MNPKAKQTKKIHHPSSVAFLIRKAIFSHGYSQLFLTLALNITILALPLLLLLMISCHSQLPVAITENDVPYADEQKQNYAYPKFNEIDPIGQWLEIRCPNNSICLSKNLILSDLGLNEQILSIEDSLLLGHDRPETNWDDRLVLLSWRINPDDAESPLIGDINGNGILDIYIDAEKFPWSEDQIFMLVIWQDPEDRPIDAVLITNDDKVLNETSRQSLEQLHRLGQWRFSRYPGSEKDALIHPYDEFQTKIIGELMSWQRKTLGDFLLDSNSKEDWQLSSPSPGRT